MRGNMNVQVKWLILCEEIIVIYSKNHIEPLWIKCRVFLHYSTCCIYQAFILAHPLERQMPQEIYHMARLPVSEIRVQIFLAFQFTLFLREF